MDGWAKSSGCPSVVKNTRDCLYFRVHATGCVGGYSASFAVLLELTAVPSSRTVASPLSGAT